MENISVSVRLRSPHKQEEREGCAWKIDGRCIYGLDADSSRRDSDSRRDTDARRSPSYTADHVFGPECTNDTLYQEALGGLVHDVVDGKSVTIMVYGQTGSGKTYTMGTPDCPGIIQRALNDTFDQIAQRHDRDYLLRFSYLEIYNENVTDMLSPEKIPKGLLIKEDKVVGPVVLGLSEEIVTCPEDVLRLLKQGEAKRHVAYSRMNERSNRSHTVARMVLESRPAECRDAATIPVTVSSLVLVDLAGSESVAKSGAEGDRLKESSCINKSLLALGEVVYKLSEGAVSSGAHIPYRDSKLTRILKPSLGGNAKTAIICTINPALRHVEESHRTLRFAARAKRVVNNVVVTEVLSDNAALRWQAKEFKEQQRKRMDCGGVPTFNTRGSLIPTLRLEPSRSDEERGASRGEMRLREVESARPTARVSLIERQIDSPRILTRKKSWSPTGSVSNQLTQTTQSPPDSGHDMRLTVSEGSTVGEACSVCSPRSNKIFPSTEPEPPSAETNDTVAREPSSSGLQGKRLTVSPREVQEAMERWRAENGRLLEENAKLRSGLQPKLVQEMQWLTATIATHEALNAQLQSERDAALQMVEGLQTENAELKRTCAELHRQHSVRLAETTEALAVANARAGELDALVRHMQREVEAATATVETAKSRNRVLAADAAEASARHEAAMRDMRTQLRRAETDAEEARRKAAAEVEGARRRAAAEVEEARRKAVTEVEGVKRQADEELEKERRRASEELAAERRRAAEELEEQHRRMVRELAEQRRRALEEPEEERRRMRTELEAARMGAQTAVTLISPRPAAASKPGRDPTRPPLPLPPPPRPSLPHAQDHSAAQPAPPPLSALETLESLCLQYASCADSLLADVFPPSDPRVLAAVSQLRKSAEDVQGGTLVAVAAATAHLSAQLMDAQDAAVRQDAIITDLEGQLLTALAEAEALRQQAKAGEMVVVQQPETETRTPELTAALEAALEAAESALVMAESRAASLAEERDMLMEKLAAATAATEAAREEAVAARKAAGKRSDDSDPDSPDTVQRDDQLVRSRGPLEPLGQPPAPIPLLLPPPEVVAAAQGGNGAGAERACGLLSDLEGLRQELTIAVAKTRAAEEEIAGLRANLQDCQRRLRRATTENATLKREAVQRNAELAAVRRVSEEREAKLAALRTTLLACDMPARYEAAEPTDTLSGGSGVAGQPLTTSSGTTVSASQLSDASHSITTTPAAAAAAVSLSPPAPQSSPRSGLATATSGGSARAAGAERRRTGLRGLFVGGEAFRRRSPGGMRRAASPQQSGSRLGSAARTASFRERYTQRGCAGDGSHDTAAPTLGRSRRGASRVQATSPAQRQYSDPLVSELLERLNRLERLYERQQLRSVLGATAGLVAQPYGYHQHLRRRVGSSGVRRQQPQQHQPQQHQPQQQVLDVQATISSTGCALELSAPQVHRMEAAVTSPGHSGEPARIVRAVAHGMVAPDSAGGGGASLLTFSPTAPEGRFGQEGAAAGAATGSIGVISPPAVSVLTGPSSGSGAVASGGISARLCITLRGN